VNETLAQRHLDGEAVGRRLHLVIHEMDVEVVGVVRDVRPFRPGEPTMPQIFWPVAQAPRWAVHFLVRSATPPGPLAAQVRERLAEVDPDVHLGSLFTLEDQVEGRLVAPRFHTALIAGFALVAVAIAGVGVYGVLAFAVSRRSREIGVRRALGATRRDVLVRVLSSGGRLAGVGLAAGLAASLVAARLLRGLLAGVEPADPVTLLAASAGLVTLALVASLAPALRATRVDPARVLRHE
jgi:putative ABC transport system permease protein